MRRRPLLLLGLLCLLALLGAAATPWLLSLRPGVTPANFERIRVGMTVQEVEGLLGCAGTEGIDEPSIIIWQDNQVVVLVTLDERRCVATKWWDELTWGRRNHRQETLWESLRRWAGL